MCNQVKTRSYWIRVGPNPMTGVLIIKAKFGRAHDNGGRGDRDWSDVSISQGTPSIAGNC